MLATISFSFQGQGQIQGQVAKFHSIYRNKWDLPCKIASESRQ